MHQLPARAPDIAALIEEFPLVARFYEKLEDLAQVAERVLSDETPDVRVAHLHVAMALRSVCEPPGGEDCGFFEGVQRWEGIPRTAYLPPWVRAQLFGLAGEARAIEKAARRTFYLKTTLPALARRLRAVSMDRSDAELLTALAQKDGQNRETVRGHLLRHANFARSGHAVSESHCRAWLNQLRRTLSDMGGVRVPSWLRDHLAPVVQAAAFVAARGKAAGLPARMCQLAVELELLAEHLGTRGWQQPPAVGPAFVLSFVTNRSGAAPLSSRVSNPDPGASRLSADVLVEATPAGLRPVFFAGLEQAARTEGASPEMPVRLTGHTAGQDGRWARRTTRAEQFACPGHLTGQWIPAAVVARAALGA